MFLTYNPNRHWGCRVNDQVTWFGMRAILLQNELVQIIVLVDKGAEIVQFLYKPLDVDFLWHSENSFHDPGRFIPTGANSSTTFFDHWTGGWFEVLPNGGPGCHYKGAELGNFAETINIPWEYRIEEDSPEQITIALWVKTYRTPFMLKKKLILKSKKPVLFIEEEVTNQGNEIMDLMWGHHPVIGEPFLDDTCRIYSSPSTIEVFGDEDGPDHRLDLFQVSEWPYANDRMGNRLDLSYLPSKQERSMDNFYLKDLKEGWVAVNNPGLGIGFGFAWDVSVFRYVWVWQALGGGIGYPWYSRTYNLGIEPWTSYPCVGLEQAVKMNTSMKLHPGKSIQTWLNAVAFTGFDEVNRIDRQGLVT